MHLINNRQSPVQPSHRGLLETKVGAPSLHNQVHHHHPAHASDLPHVRPGNERFKGRSPEKKTVLLDLVQITLTPPPNLDNLYHFI